MTSQQCQLCETSFSFTTADRNFYGKMELPYPTFCPSCRFQRRLTWRNERSLYRRVCDRSGKDVISIFHPDSQIVIYDRDRWWNDSWDAEEFGLVFSSEIPFFLQLQTLLKKVPFPALFSGRSENTHYSNHVGEMKDCYLTFASWDGEGLLFSSNMHSSKDCADCLSLNKSELCYSCIEGERLFECRYVLECENCSDCSFCFDCVGCSRCFGSTNLRHKQYYIFNQPYTKEEYLQKIKEYDLSSYHTTKTCKEKFSHLMKEAVHRFAKISNCEDVTGDYLLGIKNSFDCFNLTGEVRDCRYTTHGGYGLADCYDGYGVGAQTELLYEVVDCGDQGMQYISNIVVWGSTNVSYSINCHSCRDCFGCIGLRNKSFCILNRQYQEDEYHIKRREIIKQMNTLPFTDSKNRVYRYGDFFPTELSPYAYNETLAYDFFPLTPLACKEKGFLWREAFERSPVITLRSENLPDTLPQEKSRFLNETLECKEGETTGNPLCTTAFRLTQKELEFYQKMNLPLPRSCPNCRHHQRTRTRRPPQLWERSCQCNVASHQHQNNRCEERFFTSYNPNRQEKVYCERCYQEEVV